MAYLLIIIITLLTYIAFFTPEKRHRRKIKYLQKIFNTPTIEISVFDINDSRNNTHPEEIVLYKNERVHRKLAVLFYEMESK